MLRRSFLCFACLTLCLVFAAIQKLTRKILEIVMAAYFSESSFDSSLIKVLMSLNWR